MALRLTAPSEDILGANYKITKIVASDYNPNIDSTITVTVTVKDVYDGPVENESVQVTCNIGKFTKLNGSTISDTQSVTGNTDSNGQFTLTYSCTEWGLATFSANNESTHIKVQSVQIQYISTSSKSCASLYSEKFTATVKAKPTGYEYMFVPSNSYRSVTMISGLSGTTATFEVTNINNVTQNVAAKGWLIYYPNNFTI